MLRGVDFQETSRIVTFITPVRGRLTCMVKGLRRPKNPQGSMLEVLNRVDLAYYWRENREVQQLKEATLLDSFPAVKRDLDRSLRAALPLELAGHVVQANEPSQETYWTLVHGMESLAAWPGDVGVHTAWQMVRLLAVAGFAPEPETMELETSVTVGRPATQLSGADRQALSALLAGVKSCPAIQVSGTLRRAILDFAAHQLDCTFRSARVLKQIYG